MKNLLKESPWDNFFGNRVERARLVDDKDIRNKKVLDVGCGFGSTEYNCLKRGVREIVGLDPNIDSRTALDKLNDSRVKFCQGYAAKLPFGEKQFDTVICWETIEHLPKGDEGAMLKEIYRVLKPNGRFYLSTQNNNFWSTILDPAWWLIGHRHYSKAKIRRFVETQGFEVEKIYTKGGIYTITYGLNMYLAKWLFGKPAFFKEWHQGKCTEEYDRSDGITNIFLKAKKL